jgi:hypothetical protein
VLCLLHQPVARMAAGVTWASRTTSAPWAGRSGHTSVIDAAGAIYVIGGEGSADTYLNDVWKSTDGGADRLLEGYSRGYSRVLKKQSRGTQVLKLSDRVLVGPRDVLWVLRGHSQTVSVLVRVCAPFGLHSTYIPMGGIPRLCSRRTGSTGGVLAGTRIGRLSCGPLTPAPTLAPITAAPAAAPSGA